MDCWWGLPLCLASPSNNTSTHLFLTDLSLTLNSLNELSLDQIELLSFFNISSKYVSHSIIISVADLPKHAHLQFHTKDKSSVLSFVDYRRFGSWKINGDWGADRGPDPVTQYQVSFVTLEIFEHTLCVFPLCTYCIVVSELSTL